MREIKAVKKIEDPCLPEDMYEFTLDMDGHEYKMDLFDSDIKQWVSNMVRNARSSSKG
jgi:hypothetical protein